MEAIKGLNINVNKRRMMFEGGFLQAALGAFDVGVFSEGALKSNECVKQVELCK